MLQVFTDFTELCEVHGYEADDGRAQRWNIQQRRCTKRSHPLQSFSITVWFAPKYQVVAFKQLKGHQDVRGVRRGVLGDSRLFYHRQSSHRDHCTCNISDSESCLTQWRHDQREASQKPGLDAENIFKRERTKLARCCECRKSIKAVDYCQVQQLNDWQWDIQN